MRIVKVLVIGYLTLSVIYAAYFLIMGDEPSHGLVLAMRTVGVGLMWPAALLSYLFVMVFCVWGGASCL